MAEAPGFTPSLNRSVIAGLPGLPAELTGARAFDWLSSVGIARLVRRRLPDVELDPVPDGLGRDSLIAARPYPRLLDARVAAGDEAAMALSNELGAALAGLIATLLLGPRDARAARPEWPAAHWERWAAVHRVGLGGGIVSGALGRRLVASATTWLPRLGVAEVRLFIADDPGLVALRGAGSRLPDGPAVLVDAGLTWIKLGRAEIRDGRCLGLTRVAALRPPFEPRGAALADVLADAAAEAAGVPGDAASADAVVGPPVSSAGFAVAADTDADGQPLAGQPGLYGSLGEIPLASRLSGRLRDRLGRPVTVRTANDGDAAAAALTGLADAVIMLGTAIGAGLNV